MPAEPRGWVRRRKGGWQACWREAGRQRTGPHLFGSKTEAKRWLDDNLTHGQHVVEAPDMTFAEHLDRYLRVHSSGVQPATIRTLQDRLGVVRDGRREQALSRRSYRTALEEFGDVKLTDLERMSAVIAEWQATLPSAYRYAIIRSLRQVLEAAVRWDLMRTNPAKHAGPNPQPRREEVAFFESLADVDRLALELGQAGGVKHRISAAYGPIAIFGVETGLRPSEWIALERRDIDRKARVVRVRRAIVDGKMQEHGKTARSRRDVPLTARALKALDTLPARVDTPLLFPSRGGGFINLDNWRRREWRPALEAAGLRADLSPYTMRHSYASFALAADISIFDLARLMGTSVKVIDDTYGHLVHDTFDRARAALERRAAAETARAKRARRLDA
jgi:integrase